MLIEKKEELKKIQEKKPSIIGILSKKDFIALSNKERQRLINERNFVIFFYDNNLLDINKITPFISDTEISSGTLYCKSPYTLKYYNIANFFQSVLEDQCFRFYTEIFPLLGVKYVEIFYDKSLKESENTKFSRNSRGELSGDYYGNVQVQGDVDINKKNASEKIFEQFQNIKIKEEYYEDSLNIELAEKRIKEYNLENDNVVNAILNKQKAGVSIKKMEKELHTKAMFSSTLSTFSSLKLNVKVDFQKTFSVSGEYINIVLKEEVRRSLEEIKFKIILEFFKK